MLNIKKVPYYEIKTSSIPFSMPKWKEYAGVNGCVPLNTPHGICMDKLAPGEPKSFKPPEPEPAKPGTMKAPAPAKPPLPRQALPRKSSEPADAEDCENPPSFDLLDVPEAMERMKWPVAARLARRWFSGPKHVWDNSFKTDQPFDNTTVTLDWTLKFGKVKERYDELISKNIYNENAGAKLRELLRHVIKEKFTSSVAFDFQTVGDKGNPVEFCRKWQFQFVNVSSFDTTEGLPYVPTDLTAALANFNIYAAIGRAEFSGDKYYKYDNHEKTKTYCVDLTASITHIYAYIKDSYSFNDEKPPSSSQYLGHWNKNGMIITNGGRIRELLYRSGVNSNIGDSLHIDSRIKWKYLIDDFLDKPIDTRKGLVKKFRACDVHYPVFNKTYNDWRIKHNRGEDFVIYSKFRYLKLANPIKLSLGEICRSPEKI
ncbi:hypothetical protein DF047_34190 [Burkholderia cenocepacia]|uniref:DUF6402 family protein n=1 Tax=Burkholderia cenocepacia TaxID=95486 RepID=UPI000F5C11DF|nr:DUF6402 family protein [Burkholderia cenocepacia]RQU99821.1 hypothetical protein DF047_34190 [Burkholderia cenocepacia]